MRRVFMGLDLGVSFHLHDDGKHGVANLDLLVDGHGEQQGQGEGGREEGADGGLGGERLKVVKVAGEAGVGAWPFGLMGGGVMHCPD